MVPVAGNAYRLAPNPASRGLGRQALNWSDPHERYAVYFHVDRPCDVRLAAVAKVEHGKSALRVVANEEEFELSLDQPEFMEQPIGTLRLEQAGYVRVELQGKTKEGDNFGSIRDIIVRSDTSGLTVTCVAKNDGNMFYWGRRGPSVHLTYTVPKGIDLEYVYSEVIVKPGDDPVGSYFMANGFAEGYFGIQVNSETERRVLFSVWSPFQTDDPRNIPPDQRVELLARGPDVQAGEFGNEGSGGQSYLVYPWSAGKTYRFLTRVVPDGEGSTIYTSWFGDKAAEEWRLIASFRRPKTSTYLKGFHSFLENFNPNTGHSVRRGGHANVWVCDRDGQWHECLQARFSVDATGRGGHRLDFAGGADGDTFYLRNCGFFSPPTQPGTKFERAPSPSGPPQIDWTSLPRQ